MLRIALRAVFLTVVAAVGSSSSSAWAVDPNPLQNAYWRFEEGTPFQPVTPENAEVVLDSINQNHMRAFKNVDTGFTAAPSYTNVVPPKPLQSGLANTLAMDFLPNRDIYADGRKINNGMIKAGGGFTVEAAFYSYNPNRYGGIVAKEGTPSGSGVPTFALKTTGAGDAAPSHLRLQQYDAAGNLVNVDSLQPIAAEQWYYTAVVNDGSQVSLWLDSGTGYELQGSAPVDGALYQGPKLLGDFNGDTIVDAADYVTWRDNFPGDVAKYNQWRADFGKKNDWLKNWTIGRAEFNNAPADWFDGIIDEVRLSNTALTPSQFLFAPAAIGSGLGGGNVPEPGSVSLVALAVVATKVGRGRRTRC